MTPEQKTLARTTILAVREAIGEALIKARIKADDLAERAKKNASRVDQLSAECEALDAALAGLLDDEPAAL